MENRTFGLIMICIAFAAPIVTYRVTYAKGKSDAGLFLTILATLAGLMLGIVGLKIATGQ